jgi:leader peptidase (prepilin peptidase)/N-methyltransferase
VFVFDLIAGAWFFVLGSVFGSFMNVVVYRTPRGKSIVGPSRCPQCAGAIRWYDNVPILGWFFLRGKCRDCGLPISFRYPTVEFVTACLFLVLAIAELFSGGANLPGFHVDPSAGFAGVIADTNWPLVGIYALQVWLLSTLFCWGLIGVDEMTIPNVQISGMWIIALAIVTIWPDSSPLHYAGVAGASPGAFARWDGFRTAALGFLAAGVIYLLWTSLQRWVAPRMFDGQRESIARNTAFCAGLGSIGLVLGWQAVVSILFLTALSRGIFALSSFRSPNLRSTPLLIDMMLATVIHLCFWSRLWMLPSWPGAGTPGAALAGTAIALLVLTFAAPPGERNE